MIYEAEEWTQCLTRGPKQGAIDLSALSPY